MSITVLIPWAPADDTRTRARDWIINRWRTVHGMPAKLATSDADTWCKADAVNPAAAATDANLLIVADADSFVEPHHLASAIFRALAHGWAKPHSTTVRLTAAATDTLYTQPGVDVSRLPRVRSPYPATPGGGIILVRRDVWDLVGGFDPRFVGWGGEDHALGMALSTMAGPTDPTAGGRLWHLWHTPAPDCRQPNHTSRMLARRYTAAAGNPEQMALLIGER